MPSTRQIFLILLSYVSGLHISGGIYLVNACTYLTVDPHVSVNAFTSVAISLVNTSRSILTRKARTFFQF